MAPQASAPGRFIVFEGGEGAGKSTQLRLLAQRLTAAGVPVVTTREPGGTPTAEAIRSVLLTPAADPMAARCEALLFAAARADHVERVIAPALAAGQVVLCDRFVDSSLAYQGYARSLAVEEVRALSTWATGGLVPDVTVLLDIAPTQGLARAQDGNRMEAEAVQFHERVRLGLLDLAAAAPERYLVLAADDDADNLAEQVHRRVEPLLSSDNSAAVAP